MTKVHAATVVGAIVAIASGYELHTLIRGTPVDRPIFWAVFAIFGLAMFLMFPGLVGQYFAKALGFLPWVKRYGERPEDVPLEAAPPGTVPGALVEKDPATDESPNQRGTS